MIKPHEIETYRQLEAMLKTHRKCCLIADTGVGKSRLSSHFIETHKLNALIISHRTSINDEWKSWGSPYITAITTQYFYMHYEEFTTGFDIYIFDECQYIGAPKWGEAYNVFISLIPEEVYVLGLTATPNRYERNLIVNIAEKAFGGHIVYGIEKEEAIRLGVIHRSSYVYALYNAGELITNYYEKDMTYELRGSLDTFRNMPQIKDILIKHAPKDAPKKGIVYMHDIDSIEEGEVIIRETFPDEQIWSIHSNMPKNDTNKYREEFKKSESGFLVNVDMASEGLHYPGVNMIIMLSKTGSPNKFKQRVGRGSNTPGCVVFDLVGSFVSVRKTLDRIDKDIVGFTKASSGFGFEELVSDQEIVYDYVTDLLMVLQEIDDYNSSTWTKEEDKILRENYPTMGGDVCKLLPNRSRQACYIRACIYGLNFTGNIKWTEEEDKILRENYPTMGNKSFDMLPGKTSSQCYSRTKTLGVKFDNPNHWTEEEDKILRENYPTMGSKVCNLIPNKSSKKCKSRAIKLGVKYAACSKNTVPWSKEEDMILKEHYPLIGCNVCKLLPGRTKTACKGRAYVLNLKNNRCIRWDKSEDEIIINNFAKMGKKVAKLLPGRTEDACSFRASQLGVTGSCGEKWTEEEDEILINNYKKSKKLNENLDRRTIGSCKNRLGTLGVERDKCVQWSEDEDKILRENYPTIGYKVCKLLPGRSKSSCKSRAKLLNIHGPSNRWTEEEDKILRENYPIMGSKAFAMIPDKPISSCRNRVNKLGINFSNFNWWTWTEEEDKILRENYPTMGSKSFAMIPDKPISSCRNRVVALGLKYIG